MRRRLGAHLPPPHSSQKEASISRCCHAVSLLAKDGCYLDDKRVDQTDEHGRSPLLTTTHRRVSKSTIRTYFYAWTRPCAIGMECPYGRDPRECDAAKRNNWAFKCPDSLSTHPVRKGYITASLKDAIPKMVLSERCDVSEKILDRHYDFRTKQEKMEARMRLIKMAHQQNQKYGA